VYEINDESAIFTIETVACCKNCLDAVSINFPLINGVSFCADAQDKIRMPANSKRILFISVNAKRNLDEIT
jgi:hypothetical protein